VVFAILTATGTAMDINIGETLAAKPTPKAATLTASRWGEDYKFVSLRLGPRTGGYTLLDSLKASRKFRKVD
jgi:hypothetical protein